MTQKQLIVDWIHGLVTDPVTSGLLVFDRTSIRITGTHVVKCWIAVKNPDVQGMAFLSRRSRLTSAGATRLLTKCKTILTTHGARVAPCPRTLSGLYKTLNNTGEATLLDVVHEIGVTLRAAPMMSNAMFSSYAYLCAMMQVPEAERFPTGADLSEWTHAVSTLTNTQP